MRVQYSSHSSNSNSSNSKAKDSRSIGNDSGNSNNSKNNNNNSVNITDSSTADICSSSNNAKCVIEKERERERRREEGEERIEEVILSNSDQIVIGYDNYRKRFYAIPSSSRVHTLVVGETGSGKSETLKLLIYQHILRREGFMLIDPHGSLARSVLKLLKDKLGEGERGEEEEFSKRIIYINPEVTSYRINPLEIKDYSRSHVVVMSFISALKNLYEYAWGDRLETILRNAINLVVECDPPCTLAKVARVLADNRYRDMLVRGSGGDKDMEYFWQSVYPNYAREAFTAVYNKLDKLLSIASVRRTFNVEESNLDIEEAIEGQKVIIVDLASGFTDDIIKFLASLFIHMLYITARRRIDRYSTEELQSREKQYYLYIDEAQIIASFAIREVLNALRKFNIKVTLATQTINAFEKQVQKELPALCRTIICFRSDPDTAESFAYLFAVKPEQIYTLPLHYFYFYSQGEEVVKGLAKGYVI